MINSGEIETDEDLFQVCEILLRSNGFVFCPGISYDAYFNDFYPVIRFHCKPVNVMECPVKCVNSKSCKRWFKLPKNATREEQASNEVLCGACKRLNSILKYQKSKSSLVSPAKRQKRQAPNSNYPLKFLSPASVQKRKEIFYQKSKSSLVSPAKRQKRQAPNSNYPLKFLSPASVQKRKEKTQQERSKALAFMDKYSKLDVTLDDTQHDEMCQLVGEVDKHSDHLEEVYKEASTLGKADSIREVWQMDRERDTFINDQLKNSKLCC